jgi:alanyl-tRNA synthetase
MKTPKEQLEEKLQSMAEELKTAQRKLASLQSAELSTMIPRLAEQAIQIGDVVLVSSNLGVLSSVDDLRSLTVQLRDRFASQSAVAALIATIDDKPMIVVATTESARTAGQKAGALVRAASQILGGGGGGKDDVAQGGGQDVSKIDLALEAVRGALGA